MQGLFQGAGIAIVTPFKEGAIDWDAYARLIEFQLAGGTDCILPCGTTGEPAVLSEKEKEDLIRFTVEKVDGRVPVIAGTGSNSTAHAVDSSQRAQELGVDGVLVVTPYYNRATQHGLIEHYTTVADAVDVPVMLYNVPGRTGVNMLPETVLELSAHPKINAVKEACGNLEQIMELFRLCRGKLAIYSGNDDHVYLMMALGGDGVVSVASHILPQEMHDIAALYLAGNVEGSRDVQEAINPLVDLLFCEVSPIPVKAALSMMGMVEDEFRLPLTPMSPEPRAVLRQAMEQYGLLS